MRIDFFEEIPTLENLSKAKLIDFPSTIYLAAYSLKDFRELEKNLSLINPELEAGYWPILEKSYIISPFCYTYELENLIIDLKKNKYNKTLKVLIDLELPLWNKSQIKKNLCFFYKNKRLIESLFKNADEFNITIVTAEYPAPSKFLQDFLRLFGLSYSIRQYSHTMSIMFYTSMIEKYHPKFLNNNGINTVIIFRLGGLNESYINVIKKYL